ncbi:hypothetical protein [Dethiobacter alkaliphilus]|uniref:hypothetical protein n=1 Tax=Dethiobacter alkaliphilus TaxID=427926 RepID=UPI00058AF69F|nr:hypothetical protein [Dethiobacter alkaliphilus]MCW3491628.1 hypothetical protein [Dethiobacter alkaliphilus]
MSSWVYFTFKVFVAIFAFIIFLLLMFQYQELAMILMPLHIFLLSIGETINMRAMGNTRAGTVWAVLSIFFAGAFIVTLFFSLS